jgi:hypothetical protein
LEKRGEGRFSEEYVFSIMDSLVIIPKLGLCKEAVWCAEVTSSGIVEFRD